MAITYVKKTCPHCQKTFERYSSRTGKHEYWGSPVQNCPHCGGIVIDGEYDEIARRPYKTHYITIWKLIFHALPLLALGGLIFIAGIALLFEGAFLENGAWIPLPLGTGLLALALFSIKRSYEDRDIIQENYKREWEASKERLSHPEYAKMLRDNGYSVPVEFFPDEYSNFGEREDLIALYKQKKNKKKADKQAEKSAQSENRTHAKIGDNVDQSEQKTTIQAPQKSILYCRKCGAQIPSDSNFCCSCGEKVVL